MDTVAPSSSVPRISPSELAARLGRPDAPLLLDVRRPPRFHESPRLLAGALHCDPDALVQWAAGQAPREVVVYCVYGHEVGAAAAGRLRAMGWKASVLAGGIEGGEDGVDDPGHMAQWRATAPPAICKRQDLGVTGEAPSRWITRARPKIDRVACPWLILRFIDPRASFFYVRAEQVLSEAVRLRAVAFDIPGAPITHQGEACSFDALIHAFGLEDAALHALARIVRGADTDRLALAPQCAGLLAASLGLSKLHAHDDQAMLQAALPLYDALYAWCRDAQSEQHTWNPQALPGTAS